jgi:hypothetical protein
MSGRVTGFWALAGLVVMGLIVADIWLHPAGTNAVGNTLISAEKNTGNQLIGKAA